jgi:hypothetical protein
VYTHNNLAYWYIRYINNFPVGDRYKMDLLLFDV